MRTWRNASRLGTTAGVYGVTNAVNAAVPIMLLPVLTRYLQPSDYGIVALYEILLGVGIPLVGLSVAGAISRQYYHCDAIDFPSYIGTTILLVVAATLVAGLVVAIAGPGVGRFLGFPPAWLWIVLAATVGQVLVQVTLVMWQVRMKAARFGAFRIAQTVVNLGLSIVLVVGAEMGWQGRVLGQAGSSIIFGALGLGLLIRSGQVMVRYRPQYAQQALRFGLPLIPHALGFMSMTMIDRLFVTRMLGPADLGRYFVGYQIGMGMSLIQNSFNQAWTPWLFGELKANRPGARRLIVRLTYGYFGLLVVLAVLLGLAAPYLMSFLVADTYAGSSQFVAWIAGGYAFVGMYKMVTNYIFYVGRTHLLAMITLLSVGLGVIANYTLISRYGLVGAAQASLLTFGASFVGTWAVAARAYPMPWALREPARTSGRSDP